MVDGGLHGRCRRVHALAALDPHDHWPRARHDVLVAMDGRRHASPRSRRPPSRSSNASTRLLSNYRSGLDARAIQCCARHRADRAAERARRLTRASPRRSTRRAMAASIRRCGRSSALGVSTARTRPFRRGGHRGCARYRRPRPSSSLSTRRTLASAVAGLEVDMASIGQGYTAGGWRICWSFTATRPTLRKSVARSSRVERNPALRRGASASKTPSSAARQRPARRCACRRRAYGRHHERLVSTVPRSRRPQVRSHHRSAQRLARGARAPVGHRRRPRRRLGGGVGHRPAVLGARALPRPQPSARSLPRCFGLRADDESAALELSRAFAAEWQGLLDESRGR